MKIWLYALSILICVSCATPKKNNFHHSQDFFLDTLSQHFYNNKLFKSAFLGVAIADLPSEKILAQFNSEKYFIPASTLKLFTTYATLKFNNDFLAGFLFYENLDTLFLFPCGDPSFLNSDFDSNLMEIKLNSSAKNIVLLSPEQPIPTYSYGWSWEDYAQDYMAETSSFPMYKNLVHFVRKDASIQIRPQYFSNPNYFTNQYENNNHIDIQRSFRSNQFYTIKSKSVFDSVDIPFIIGDSLFLQQNLLSQKFPNLHIKTMPINQCSYSSLLQPFPTKLLSPILKKMLLVSDNFIAEQLIINKALLQNQTNPSPAKIKDSILTLLFSNKTDRPKWVDGSGLSRYNLCSPQQFITLITKMYKEFGAVNISNLMSKGNEGTLKNLFTKYPNRIHAKTGTLSNNMALCGILETFSNKTLVFSIMINNHQEKNKILRQQIESFLNNIIEKY